MRGFDHATILSPSFHGLRKERLAQWPAFNSTKNSGELIPEKLDGMCCTLQETLISDQNLWFPLPNFRPDQKFDTLFQSWGPGAQCVTGARDKLLRLNIIREKVLSSNDEEVANSSKKHAQFKTRVYKRNPISDQNGRNWYPISDQNG